MRRLLLFASALAALAGCGGLPGGTSPRREHLPTIGRFDTAPGSDTVRVVWNAGNDLRDFEGDLASPAPDVVKVVLSISEKAEGGYVRYLERTPTGVDSVDVAGLTRGKSYFFRLETFDRAGFRIDQSRTLETQLAPVPTDLATFGDVDLDGAQYFPPLTWTPDGNSILYIANETYDSRIVAHDLRNGDDRDLTPFPGGDYFGLACAPDAEQVAFCRSTRHNVPYVVSVLDLSNGTVRDITDGPVDGDPAWATGGKLYFCREGSAAPNVRQIYSISSNDSTSLQGVLLNEQNKYGLSLSPQQDRIAYAASTPGSADLGRRNLYALTLATGQVTRLLPESSFNNIAPAWSPDGAELFFASDRSGHYEAWSLELTSGRLTRRGGGLPQGAECFAARPSPDGSRLALFEMDRLQWKGWVRVVSLR